MSAPFQYQCTECGTQSDTDNLNIIGRNCWASDFEKEHQMQDVWAAEKEAGA